MIEGVLKLGLSGGVGALAGMVAVWWVEPTTGEGTAFLVVIGIVSGVVIGGIVSQLLASKKHPAVTESAVPASNQQTRSTRPNLAANPGQPRRRRPSKS